MSSTPASPPRSDHPGRGAPIVPFAAALFAVLPMSTDIYLTAMVDLGRDFGVDIAGVQRTMLSFTLGFGLAHLFIGRFADRIGRRPTALVGLTIYTLASILAASAPSLDLLVAARFVQGMAAATGPIVSRTLIRDTVSAEGAGRALSKMGAFVGIAPLTAPLLGTFAAHLGGWRATIVVLVLYGAILTTVLWRRLPETRPAAVGGGDGISIVAALGRLVRHRVFLIGVAALAAGYGILLTWLTTSGFLLIGTLGMSKLEASAVYTIGSAGFVSGSLVSMRLAQRLLPRHILRTAAALLILGTTMPALVLWLGFGHWAVILVTVFPFYFGWGIGQPMAIAITMQPFPEMAGQASAWLGLFQQVGGIALSLVAAHFGGGLATPLTMALGALLFTAAVFVPPPKVR
ncbi:multidrug effflux MFS transporter [Pinisolibacter sp.]|uniref:multidrug effflux MFS transporter n=1 Tax=Pinisolibacter sp. TaxID=2172024 RepID=UPI002FDD185A